MKKLYSALLTLLLLASIPALAQKGLYFGIAGTVQSTWITNQENYGLHPLDYVSTMGGSGNINIGYDFTNHIGIKIELGYGTLGQKYSKTRTDSVFSRQVKLNYLMIPILLKYRIGGPVVKFYIAVGPQFNMLLSANQTYTSEWWNVHRHSENHFRKTIRSGAEMGLKTGSPQWMFLPEWILDWILPLLNIS